MKSNLKNSLSLLVLFILLPWNSQALQCLSGNENSTHLIDQMKATANNPKLPGYYILQSTKEDYQPEGRILNPGFCTDEACKVKQSQIEDLKKFAEESGLKSQSTKNLFKTECMIAGSQFKSGTDEIKCPSNEKTKKSFNFCINTEFLNYQNTIISQFKACADASNMKTLDAAHLFKMYTLESSFKPYYSYDGGVGLGQLTSIFVKDLHQKHRGQKNLKKIAALKSPECKAAQMIAEADLVNPPSHSDKCAFVTVGSGLERNILYSILGLALSWEKDIEPKLSSYIEKYKNDPLIEEVKNLALLNSYGPGRADARAAIARLINYPPERFVAEIKKPLNTKHGNLTKYINRIEAKQKEMTNKFLQEPLKSEYAASGAKACIN